MTGTLLLGLDGLCWPGFVDARRRGLVPQLARLMDGGATGLLSGVPMLGRIGAAGSIASGHWPEASGLWHDHELWAGGVRPVTMASWQQPPFWVALEHAGVTTASVGWPGSAPGAGRAGGHVDDRFMLVDGQNEDGWALPPDCCPPAWRDEVAGRRVHPAAIQTQHLLPLVDVAAVDQNATDALGRLAIAMAEAASAQGVAAWALATQRPQFQAVWLHWLGDVRGAATGAAPPWDRLEAGAWQFLDTLVGALAALAADRRLLIVGSGWRDAPGMLLAHGGGITRGTALPPARLIDVAPTVLALQGLHDPALPGRVVELPGAALPALRATVQAPIPTADNGADAMAYLAPLLAEGHAPPPSPPPVWQARRHIAFGRMLLPRDAVVAEREADAALALQPDDADALTLKAWCRFAARDGAGLDAIGRRLAALAPDQPWAAVARGAAAALAGDVSKARPWLEAAAKADGESRLRVAQAWLLLNHPATARFLLVRLAEEWPQRADVRLALAAAAQALGDMAAAEAALRAVIAFDPFAVAGWQALRALLDDLGQKAEAARIDGVLAQLRGA